MEIKDAKEILSPNEWLKNNYPNNKEYNWDKYKEVFMQQYAEYRVNEEKITHELEKLAEYNRGFKDGFNSNKISIDET